MLAIRHSLATFIARFVSSRGAGSKRRACFSALLIVSVTEKRHHATFRGCVPMLHNCRQFFPRQAVAGTGDDTKHSLGGAMRKTSEHAIPDTAPYKDGPVS
jgi:hypothetical protein